MLPFSLLRSARLRPACVGVGLKKTDITDGGATPQRVRARSPSNHRQHARGSHRRARLQRPHDAHAQRRKRQSASVTAILAFVCADVAVAAAPAGAPRCRGGDYLRCTGRTLHAVGVRNVSHRRVAAVTPVNEHALPRVCTDSLGR